jgi:hypothetical protein
MGDLNNCYSAEHMKRAATVDRMRAQTLSPPPISEIQVAYPLSSSPKALFLDLMVASFLISHVSSLTCHRARCLKYSRRAVAFVEKSLQVTLRPYLASVPWFRDPVLRSLAFHCFVICFWMELPA